LQDGKQTGESILECIEVDYNQYRSHVARLDYKSKSLLTSLIQREGLNSPL
jgi:hypothetical protein